MDERLGQAMQCIAEANAIAQGLAMSLDGMEDELCADARFYALRVCIDAIVEKSEEAANAIDACPPPRPRRPVAQAAPAQTPITDPFPEP